MIKLVSPSLFELPAATDLLSLAPAINLSGAVVLVFTMLGTYLAPKLS